MRRLVILIGVLALLLTACGDDDGEIVVGDDTATTTTTTTERPQPVGEDPDDGDLDEGDDAVDPDADRPAYAGGFDFDPETGEVDIAAYQAFLAEHGAPAAGPEAAAVEMLVSAYSEVEPQMSSEIADGGRTVVTVLFENLPDDSVEAHRFELVFIGGGPDLVLESGSWASRCQPGRGHEEFGIGLCL